MLNRLILSVIAVCLACGNALACRGTFSESTIIFDEVPISLDAPVIVEVTITDLSETIDPSNGFAVAVMQARVERVIRGYPDNKVVKIVTELSDCTRIGVGRGFVAGSLRYDAQGGVELVAIQESNADRGMRKAREQGK
jgi:hypothetical protein